MKVAVVTPYWLSDSEYIGACHQSVLNQTHDCHHIIVCDGCPPPELSDLREAATTILQLDKRYRDFGNTPRGIGGISALERGFDAIFFLDADNWILPDHVGSMLRHSSRTNAEFCVSRRIIVGIDGAPLGLCQSSDGVQFADTSTIALLGGAKDHARKWTTIEPRFSAIGDRIFFREAVELGFEVQRTGRATVAYRARHAAFYKRVNRLAPLATRANSGIREAIEAFRIDSGVDLSIAWRITPWDECPPEVHREWKVDGTK